MANCKADKHLKTKGEVNKIPKRIYNYILAGQDAYAY